MRTIEVAEVCLLYLPGLPSLAEQPVVVYAYQQLPAFFDGPKIKAAPN